MVWDPPHSNVVDLSLFVFDPVLRHVNFRPVDWIILLQVVFIFLFRKSKLIHWSGDVNALLALLAIVAQMALTLRAML